jgi:hypothetical protein
LVGEIVKTVSAAAALQQDGPSLFDRIATEVLELASYLNFREIALVGWSVSEIPLNPFDFEKLDRPNRKEASSLSNQSFFPLEKPQMSR